MNPLKEYALLCEFLTQSTNGLYTYAHVFDRTNTVGEGPITLNGFLAVRLRDVPVDANLEIYITDENNVLVEKGGVFKQAVKGPQVHIIAKMHGLTVAKPGEYRFAARIDGGEPMALCTWVAERKIEVAK
ncbi:TPA: hypothetical protein DEP96_03420 [Candidatus Uhrbacteria bacterium]|nr:hypothetical protein [Candidatus Uhrbacteria bacterium]